jgi:hypothetical protein
MAFVLDTNFLITLNEIGQINSLAKLKKGVLIPDVVKHEVDCFRIDLQPVKSNITVVGVTDSQVEKFISELAKNLQGNKICFVLELRGDYAKVHTPTTWSYIPNAILRDNAHAFTNVITNKQNPNMIIEKDEHTRILGHADVHVCAVITNNQKNFVLTMDASIWLALYTINRDLQKNIYPIFSSLRLLFKDDPLTFINALTLVISKKRYKFVKNILDTVAAQICYEDLLSSIDDVLQRPLSDLIKVNSWSEQKNNYMQLFSVRERLRHLVQNNTKHNGELSFDEDKFINDLKAIQTSLNTTVQNQGATK